MVKVRWHKTVPASQAVRETGFFWQTQNTVCRPQTDKWNFTVKRLKEIWHIEELTHRRFPCTLHLHPAHQRSHRLPGRFPRPAGDLSEYLRRGRRSGNPGPAEAGLPGLLPGHPLRPGLEPGYVPLGHPAHLRPCGPLHRRRRGVPAAADGGDSSGSGGSPPRASPCGGGSPAIPWPASLPSGPCTRRRFSPGLPACLAPFGSRTSGNTPSPILCSAGRTGCIFPWETRRIKPGIHT